MMVEEIKPIEPPDSHYLNAAHGWLGLGNIAEAVNELTGMNPALRAHPHVLETHWEIHKRKKRFDVCLEIGRELTVIAPKQAASWVLLAEAVYFQGRYQEAYDLLHPHLEQFPESWPVLYDMACYASLLERFEEARTWLDRAIKLGDPNYVKKRAQEDPDFAPLWKATGGIFG
ncbi:MAG: tetratricopeptide repeat protein [Verrucomicrobiota bacterium]